jgi:hypothetical protein
MLRRSKINAENADDASIIVGVSFLHQFSVRTPASSALTVSLKARR